MEVDPPEQIPTNLTSEALKRKERLRMLREKATGKGTDAIEDSSSKLEENLPK